MDKLSACPNCNGNNIYIYKKGVSAGGFAADYLPGLGGFMYHASLYPAICADCGHVRFFIDEDAKSKLESSPEWEKR